MGQQSVFKLYSFYSRPALRDEYEQHRRIGSSRLLFRCIVRRSPSSRRRAACSLLPPLLWLCIGGAAAACRVSKKKSFGLLTVSYFGRVLHSTGTDATCVVRLAEF